MEEANLCRRSLSKSASVALAGFNVGPRFDLLEHLPENLLRNPLGVLHGASYPPPPAIGVVDIRMCIATLDSYTEVTRAYRRAGIARSKGIIYRQPHHALATFARICQPFALSGLLPIMYTSFGRGCLLTAPVARTRKSPFVRLFDKTPQGVVCPHFYELILSNGCPFDCAYCYLRLTFRGKKSPVLFSNGWLEVERQIEAVPSGVFSTGELADSLAVVPPLLPKALDYFSAQSDRYLLLVTKSTKVGLLLKREPASSIIVSFSVNAPVAANLYERGCPDPYARLEAAAALKERGWRIRIRLDPVILDVGLDRYREICTKISWLKPERVTVGSLRQYPGLFRFAPDAPRKGLSKARDGRMRYPLSSRVQVYRQLAEWLGQVPALCKETTEVWSLLGWNPSGCNCTV